MRILICNYEYPPLGGGGGVATAQLAQELTKKHEVTVLTSHGLDLSQEDVEEGVRIIRAPVFFRKQQASANILSMLAYVPMGIRRGKRLLKAEEFDVINTHFVLPSGPVGASLSKFAGIPNVLTVHGGDLYDPSKYTSPHRHMLLRAWIRRLLRDADMVVGQSKNTLSNVEKFYTQGLDADRIPLGIQRPPSVAVNREDYGFSEDEVLLVTVGRLVARKASSQLVTMMSKFDREKVRLLVVGTGPEEIELRRQAESLGLGDSIRFMGFVENDEKFRLLQMSDVFVSTSQHEGFGLMYLEGMAYGLPIVCYDHGGQNDFLDDGETGYVVPLNDQETFESRCRSLINNPDHRSVMGKENLKRVEELFIDNCAERYEELFEHAMATHQKEHSIGVTHRT